MLNVAVPEIILNEPRIGSLVGESEAAGVAQHVGMGEEGQGGGRAVSLQRKIHGRAVQGLALLTHEERLALRLHPGALPEPCADGFELVGA